MKTKISEWITTVAFCAFLGIMTVLFVVLPKQEMSETEKRNLEKTPQYSWENLSSGKFGEDIESYMADHIPGRDFFVGVHSYVEFLTGRQVTKDIYVAEGDRLVEKPLVWNQQTETNIQAVTELSNKLSMPVDLMIVPSGGWAVRDQIVGLSNEYIDPQLIGKIESLAGDKVNIRDVASVFASYEDPGKLYYRTDHHWTSLGAYTAYKTYMEQLGLPYTAREDFTVKTVEDFKGTTHSRAALWLIPGEPLEMWTGSENITVRFGKSDDSYNKVFFENRLQELDKYTVFLDGNHDLVTLENPDAPVDETLLVIRDSYSNCLGPFLAQTYKKVVLVDLRYYNEAVADYCTLNSVDRVVVLYSLSNFMTDINFGRLYMTQNLCNLATKTYTNEELEAIKSFEGNYYELGGKYPIQCSKQLGDSYRVSYLGQDRVAVLVFNSKGEKLSGQVYTTTCTLEELTELAVGDSVEKVKQVHPDAYFPLITMDKDRVRSEHYTSDGFLVTVYYDQDVITEITTELI